MQPEGSKQRKLTLVISLAADLGHTACLAEEVCHLGIACLETYIAHKHSLVVLSGHHSCGVPIAACLGPLHPPTMCLPQLHHVHGVEARGGGWARGVGRGVDGQGGSNFNHHRCTSCICWSWRQGDRDGCGGRDDGRMKGSGGLRQMQMQA